MQQENNQQKIKKFPKQQEIEIRSFGNSYFLPVQAKRGSVGYDLTLAEDAVIPARTRFAIPLNIGINLPFGLEAKIEPRSGLSMRGMEGFGQKKVRRKLYGFIPWWTVDSGKLHFDADVLVGKIDPGYTDNIHVIVKNNDEEFLLRRGFRIAQLTFYRTVQPKFKCVECFGSGTYNRGGGLGSSGTSEISENGQTENGAEKP